MFNYDLNVSGILLKFPLQYNCEFDMATIEALLVDAQIPGTIVLDKKRDLWGKVGIRTWPTVLVCSKNRILFALEGSRTFDDVSGRAISAGISACGLNSKQLTTFQSQPPLNAFSKPIPGVLRHPTRIAINKLTGNIFIFSFMYVLLSRSYPHT